MLRTRIARVTESRLFWKYLALILALVLLAVYLAAGRTGAFNRLNLAQNLFYAVVTSLLVALFYDFGSRRDLAGLLEAERVAHAQSLGQRVLPKVNVSRLGPEDAEYLAEQLASDARMVRLVAAQLVGEDAGAFYDTWLAPLVDKTILRNVAIEDRLAAIPEQPESYVLEHMMRFEISRAKRSFLIIFTCSHELYYDLVTSSAPVDDLRGSSREEWGEVDTWVSSLSVEVVRDNERRRTRVALKAVRVTADELAGRLDRRVPDAEVRAYEFDLSEWPDATFEVRHSVRNRLSDPYFFWTALNPMYLNRVEIDYRDVQRLVGRVTGSCTFGASAGDPENDTARGVYRVPADCWVWPGQGALVVWRTRAPGETREP